MQVVTESNISALNLLSRGKVRDIYELDKDTLLMVTTDRMSAFDVIMAEPVPYKGVVLNQLTVFWMKLLEGTIANHLLATEVQDFPEILAPYADQLEGRSVLVRRADPLPIECIARGYLSGSCWENYRHTGTVCGYKLPDRLLESQRLPTPLFTPSTKAALGGHDENISVEQAGKILGDELCREVQRTTLEIFRLAAGYAEQHGLIVADTKFEFGLINGKLTLIDEVLTPDSSRFWAKADYKPGQSQPSFDKQYLRDWLAAQDWDKTPPPPALPEELIARTAAKYREAYCLITGQELKLPQNS